jgi:hypothetical protein
VNVLRKLRLPDEQALHRFDQNNHDWTPETPAQRIASWLPSTLPAAVPRRGPSDRIVIGRSRTENDSHLDAARCAIANKNDTLLASIILSCAATTVAIVVNYATDLDNPWIAWLFVLPVTVLSGLATEHFQRKSRGQPVKPFMTRPMRRGFVIAVCILAVVSTIVGVISLTTDPGGHSSIESPGQNQDRVQQADDYELISSSAFCPKTDKVDLDTAQPGTGGQPQLGEVISRCKMDGGPAELILEPNEVHTPNGARRLSLLKHGESASFRRCQDALAGQLVDRVSLRSLRQGSSICVRTDTGNIAQVEVAAVGRTAAAEARMVIDFSVWRP